MELYIHSPNTPSWRDAQLKKTQGQLYFTFTSCQVIEGKVTGNQIRAKGFQIIRR